MPHTKSANGCLPSFRQDLEDCPHLLHMELMKTALHHAKIPLLGVAEPTISARGTRRLHEENPYGTDTGQIRKRSIEAIVMEYSDFVCAQREAQSDHGQVALPRMVQFDLYHIAEAMPENRKGAAHDNLHSFFFHQEAVETLLEHCRFFIDRQAFVMLMWHAYSPVWDNLDFYKITQQSGVDSAIVLDHTVNNPFGMMTLDGSISRQEQQAIFKRVIDSLDSVATIDTKALAFRKKLDHIVSFTQSLAQLKGSAIFRPYHEHSPDGFFWWALDNLDDDPSEAERLYRRLFHKTREYLENQGVQNLLYAYSPDIPYQKAFTDKAAFLAHYRRGLPDLDMVDVLGIDAYLWKQFTPEDQEDYVEVDARPEGVGKLLAYHTILARPWERILQMIAWLREEYPDKIVGLTETGWDYSKWGELVDKPIASFWEKAGMDSVLKMSEDQRPHFICFWRNDTGASFHPYAGYSAAFSQEAIAISEALGTQVADVEVA